MPPPLTGIARWPAIVGSGGRTGALLGRLPSVRRAGARPAVSAPALPSLDAAKANLMLAKAAVKEAKAAVKAAKREAAAAAGRASSSSSSSSESEGEPDYDHDTHDAVTKISVADLVAAAATRTEKKKKKMKEGKEKEDEGTASAAPAVLFGALDLLPPHPRTRGPAVASSPLAPPPPAMLVSTPGGVTLAVSEALTSSGNAVTVCTGAACRRLGSAALLTRLRAEHAGPVRACSCLGRCGRSRAEAASDCESGDEEEEGPWFEEEGGQVVPGPCGAVVPATGFL